MSSEPNSPEKQSPDAVGTPLSAACLLHYTLSLLGTLDPAEVALCAANEIRELCEADRVTIWRRRGRRAEIMTVSGTAKFERRSRALRSLQKAVECSLPWEAALRFPQDSEHLPPAIQDSLSSYFDEVAVSEIIVVPLKPESESPAAGVLVLESFHQPLPQACTDNSLQLGGIAWRAIKSALQYHETPFRGFARTVQWIAPAKRKWLGLMMVLAALVATMLFIRVEFIVDAEGTLVPVSLRRIYAPEAAVVAEVLVVEGQSVEQSSSLLLLRAFELELEAARVSGELETKRESLAAIRAGRVSTGTQGENRRDVESRRAAQEAEVQSEIASLETQLQWLNARRERLTITAPIDGQIITWQPERTLLDRPVQRGDLLLEIVAAGTPWNVELQISDRDVGFVLDALKTQDTLPAYGTLVSQNHATLAGTVQVVASQLDVDDAGAACLPATMRFDSEFTIEPRSGQRARVGIHCGKCSFGYSLFHGVVDWVRTQWKYRAGSWDD